MVQRESRVRKTLLNARINLIFYFLTLCLSFFSRKIFLDSLGADFVGLTGTLQNLLGFLNLAELGIGSAIGYLLYKPIFEQDHDKIYEIISVMGYLYRWIGRIIGGLGCVLACFLPIIYPDTTFNILLIYIAFFAFLVSSLIGYFINYRQILLGADQRNYVVTAYFQSATIIKTLVQLTVAYYVGDLYIWVFVEFAFSIIYSIILNWRINKTYPWLKTNLKRGRELLMKYPLIIKNTKKIFLHKIGIVIQFQAAPILIYSFSNLAMVAFYANYTTILDKIVQLVNNFLGSSEAAVGNLIAEGNREKILSVFGEILTLRFWICGGMVYISYCTASPFISLWLGDNYVLSDALLILILINYAITVIHNVIGQFTYGFGLFNDVWATLTAAVLYIVLAVVLGPLYGLHGVLIAGLISLALLHIGWKPYFLFKYGFKMSVSKFWIRWLKVLLYISISVFLSSYCRLLLISLIPCGTILFSFILNLIITTLVYSVVSAVLLYLFSSDFRKLASRFINK
jgi:O-antigen/teichoic acid export membrane protein